MTETIKERIIRTLLDKPSTTGEIARKLGYYKKEGIGKYGKYNVIAGDLKLLESQGIINSSEKEIKGAHGPPPTEYDIVYEMPIFQKIWKEYPTIQEKLQRNGKVLSMLTEKHNWIISFSKSDLLQVIRDREWYLHICEFGEEPTVEFLLLNGISEDDFKEFLEEYRMDLKSKLSHSARFFELFLNNESDELKKLFMNHFLHSERGQAYEYIKTHFDLKESNGLIEYLFFSTAIEQIFKICINNDVLNGYKNVEAIETIKELNRYSPLYNNIICALEDMKRKINFSSQVSTERLIRTIFLEGGNPIIYRKNL